MNNKINALKSKYLTEKPLCCFMRCNLVESWDILWVLKSHTFVLKLTEVIKVHFDHLNVVSIIKKLGFPLLLSSNFICSSAKLKTGLIFNKLQPNRSIYLLKQVYVIQVQVYIWPKVKAKALISKWCSKFF